MGFVANFIRFTAVPKFWKSVKTWQCYRQFTGGNFLGQYKIHCVPKKWRQNRNHNNYTVSQKRVPP